MAFTGRNMQVPNLASQRQSNITRTLTESAADFQNVVWPKIASLQLVGGGQLRPVEATAETYFKEQLDLLAGIDAWQIQASPSAIRGLASRVQWGPARKTFTIRTHSIGGGETELAKRARAIANIGNGHLFPHFTVQAYLDKKGGNLLCAAVIKTTDLIGQACFLAKHMTDNCLDYGYMTNTDGSQFMYIKWDYLIRENFVVEVV